MFSQGLMALSEGGIAVLIIGAILGFMIMGDFGGILCRISFAFAVASLSTGGPSVRGL